MTPITRVCTYSPVDAHRFPVCKYLAGVESLHSANEPSGSWPISCHVFFVANIAWCADWLDDARCRWARPLQHLPSEAWPTPRQGCSDMECSPSSHLTRSVGTAVMSPSVRCATVQQHHSTVPYLYLVPPKSHGVGLTRKSTLFNDGTWQRGTTACVHGMASSDPHGKCTRAATRSAAVDGRGPPPEWIPPSSRLSPLRGPWPSPCT